MCFAPSSAGKGKARKAIKKRAPPNTVFGAVINNPDSPFLPSHLTAVTSPSPPWGSCFLLLIRRFPLLLLVANIRLIILFPCAFASPPSLPLRRFPSPQRQNPYGIMLTRYGWGAALHHTCSAQIGAKSGAESRAFFLIDFGTLLPLFLLVFAGSNYTSSLFVSTQRHSSARRTKTKL